MRSRYLIAGVFVAAIVLHSTAGYAQFGFEVVKDPWNLAENVEQIRKLHDQIQRLDRNLEKIPDRLYRDLFDQLGSLLTAAERGLVSWTSPGVADLFAELYGSLAVTPEIIEILDAQGIQQERAKGALSTFAGSLGAVATHAEDYESALAHLADLKANAGAARGNLAALEVGNMYQDATAHELVKLNQSLGALVSTQAAAAGYEIADRATYEATLNYLLDEHTEDEFPFYDGVEGQDGIPDDWPYPCFGCN